ncbi:hypothetical protein THMIRHAM_01240 [Thiomicrorhabdus immobilis]|uniref:Diguanylate cyclase/phosphodiesterase n=1 Tax=Thiomicrorhabdus immobilis TaxID=2791037 RepID=A0ABM7MAH5_9GAMM|nr:EAL domain-containing protein [Thiomicrorhabdus immobilis]BCN92339.1 hypothetical protein THMIRHAM_01240 [Thiomicrorhabdus immobilis]
MWRKLSIRIQLFSLIALMLLGFTISTLFLAFIMDQNERKELAIGLSETLNNAMSHDMLKALVDNQTDVLSDLSFRLASFDSLDRLVLYDAQDHPVYEFNPKNSYEYDHLINKSTLEPQFEGVDLYVKLPLVTDGHQFGNVAYVIDMQDFATQIDEHFAYLIIAFPLELLIGFLFTLRVSRIYSQPFETLAQAMKNSEPTKDDFPILNTRSENEIGALFRGFNQMMSQISKTSQQMRYQANHDMLTGAYNRFAMEAKLKTLLKQTGNDGQANQTPHALLHLDLDQFRIINDTASHEAGDELLKMLVATCMLELPKDAMMARMESDDFLILLTDHTEKQATLIARQVLENLNDFRFSWEGQAFSVSASIGLVMFRSFAYSLQELIKAADSALYAAKATGRNKLHLYHPDDSLTERLNQEVITAGYIKEALNKGSSRFELFAQLIEPLQYKSTKVSYEVLLRMWDCEGNFIPPDNFLPTAERYQMMAEIDQYVLWEYLTLVSRYPEHIENLHSVHINLAGSSLNHPDFQAQIKKAVNTFNFPWHKLELELTETSAVGSFSQAKAFIEWLKQVGIGLALDDFGTGMSSFEYLKSLPFDVIKIDGSFVKDMHDDPSDKAVIRYIQEISALRNQETVAEYVETAADVVELTRIGITYGQGYYLGKPKPLIDWFE